MYFARPATLERYLEGQCCKYVNNSGICPTNGDQMDDLFKKARALAHFTWLDSDRKLLLPDIQGSEYNLYDR